MRRTGFVIAVVSGLVGLCGSCTGFGEAKPCSGLLTVSDFLACNPLCGSRTTGVSCDSERSERGVEAIAMWPGHAAERSADSDPSEAPITEAPSDVWEFGILDGPDRLELVLVPDGVPLVRPPCKVRVTDAEYAPLPYSLTFYYHTWDHVGACVLHYAHAAQWTPRPDPERGECMLGGYLQVSTMLVEARGDSCPSVLRPGEARRRSSQLIVLSTVDDEACAENPCGEDGICNYEYCRIDYDCGCHRDGVCDLEKCRGDLECACMPDYHCIPGCDSDPDCACIENGECNRACLSLDPDCPCDEDDVCSPDCLADDPDCGCAGDGVCHMAPCGWSDPDCAAGG